jgi:hypothetical protein
MGPPGLARDDPPSFAGYLHVGGIRSFKELSGGFASPSEAD